MWRYIRSKIQPGKILSELRRQNSQAAEDRKRTETEGRRGQLGVKKACICEELKIQNNGKQYLLSFPLKTGLLIVRKIL